MSGSACVLPVREDGSLAPASDFIQHQGSSIDPNRQRGPHAHSVIFDPVERFAFVPDLGLDKLAAYVFDPARGKLERHERAWFKATPGAGPRHLAFRPDGRFAYLINELDSSLTTLAYDGVQGSFSELQTVPTLPEDLAAIAPVLTSMFRLRALRVCLEPWSRQHRDSPDRLRERAALLGSPCPRLEEEHHGILRLIPRGISCWQPTRIAMIVSFRIDQDSGALESTGHITQVPTPVCVKFFG